MDAFMVLLNKDLKEELYSDIDPNFLAFVMLEGIYNVVSNPELIPLRVMDDSSYLCDDPDSFFDNSVTYLLDILAEHDQAAGILAQGELYEFNSEQHEFLCRKLHEAMACIQYANSLLDLAVIRETLSNPIYARHLVFTAKHFNDRVFFTLQPGPAIVPAPVDGMVELM